MPERTRIHLNARQFIIRMADIRRTELGKLRGYLLHRKKSFLRQHRVIGFHRMPLAQHKSVPPRIVLRFRRNMHLVKIQRYQDIQHTHITANMPALAGHYYVYHMPAQVIRQQSQLFCFCIHTVSPLKYAFTSSSIGS